MMDNHQGHVVFFLFQFNCCSHLFLKVNKDWSTVLASVEREVCQSVPFSALSSLCLNINFVPKWIHRWALEENVGEGGRHWESRWRITSGNFSVKQRTCITETRMTTVHQNAHCSLLSKHTAIAICTSFPCSYIHQVQILGNATWVEVKKKTTFRSTYGNLPHMLLQALLGN